MSSSSTSRRSKSQARHGRRLYSYDALEVIDLGGPVGSVRSGLMSVHTAKTRRVGLRVTGEAVLLAALAERAPMASLRGV